MTAPTNAPPRTRADYGLDAPGVIRTLALVAASLIGTGIVLVTVGGPAGRRLGQTLLWPGISFATTPCLMLASSRYGKLRARDRLLGYLPLGGSETVLDVGCGHGLMLIGAARRLPRGQAVGLDLWSQKDQLANSAAATFANAEAEGVRDRVTVKDGDMRALPFDDASMDVVVSSLAIHNVPSVADRALAIREIARVVRPGGWAAIMDIAHVGDYAREFRRAGWTIERRGLTPWIFPPTQELVARKPA